MERIRYRLYQKLAKGIRSICMANTYKRQSVEQYILKVLQNLGGSASRDRIKEAIVSDEEIDITYENVFEPVRSRSGTSYIPFNYDFNFGVKNLFVSGLIESYKRGDDLTLTEAGRAFNYKEFPNKDQQAKIDAYWESKHKERDERNKQKASLDDELKDEPIEEDEALDDWKREALERIKQFSPKKFESFSRLLLSRMGIKFDSEKGVKMSGDHGIDGYGYFESDEFRTSKVVIQCKRYIDNSVSEPEIDKFKGVMMSFNADYGIFVTTSYFTKQAQDKAVLGGNTVTLIDGQRLVELIEKYKLHITPVQTYTLDDYYFQED